MFATTDLSPEAVSNHEMGLVFEELIRRFAEGSNETAGEHFTPRDSMRSRTPPERVPRYTNLVHFFILFLQWSGICVDDVNTILSFFSSSRNITYLSSVYTPK